MTKDRYTVGLKKIEEFSHKNNNQIQPFQKTLDSLNEIAPDIGKYIIEFVYGDVYSRTTIDNQKKALATVTALATLGTEPQLKMHINGALAVGVSKEEIIETFIHLIPYIGFPRVLNAITIIKEVLSEIEFNS